MWMSFDAGATLGRAERRCFTAALLWTVFIASIVALPAIVGWRSLGPESILDWDPLYRTGPPPARPISSDYTPINQHYPRDLAFARGLHAGRIDLWNPLVSAGAPLWAEQGAPFFPLKLPFYIAPSPSTYAVYLALRLVLAGLGAYALARRRDLAHAPALAAASGFELSGGSIASLPFGAGSPLYVLPWVVLGALAIARSPGRRAVAGAGAALALVASAGHPTQILMMFAVFAIAVAAHMLAAWRTPRAALSIGIAAAAAVVLGLLLAAPSLLPLAELARFGSSYKNRLAGTLLWSWQLIESRMTLPIALFAPGTFHALHAKFQTLFGFAPALGVLALALAVAGILARGLDAALVAVAAFGVALAAAPPGFAWLHRLPGLQLILPTYPWPLVTLALAQAAGRGIELLGERRGRRTLVVAFALVVLGASSLFLVRDVKNGPKPFATPLREALTGGAGAVRLALPYLFAAAALGGGAALARAGRGRTAGITIAAAIALELGIELAPLTWNPPPRALATADPSGAVRFLREQTADGEWRMAALPYTVGLPMTPMLFGLPDFRGSAPLPIGRYQEYLKTIDRKAAEFVFQDLPVARSPLIDAAAVRWIAFARGGLENKPRDLDAVLVFPPDKPPPDDAEMPIAYADEQIVVYENRRALPRARAVHRFTAAAGREVAQRWLAEVQHGGDAARSTIADSVVLEPGPRGEQPAPVGAASASAEESVRIQPSGEPDVVSLDARLASDGFVVLADAYYPGWQATVDGEPAPIFPADLMFRAVRAGAGAHRIEFRYVPTSFRAGLALFACGMVAFALLLRGDASRETRSA